MAPMMPLSIAGTVGRDWRNDPDDVGTVAGVLGDLGYVSALPSASSAAWAEDLDDAIRDYQGDRGLKVDGYLRPDGPTIQALGADRAGEQLRVRVDCQGIGLLGLQGSRGSYE